MDKLNQWLTLIANIGVMAGLVFLALELNQNTQATIAASSEELTNQSLDFFSLGMDNQVIARASHKQAVGEDLNSFEAYQLNRYQYMNFRVFENAFLQFARGFYDETEWARYRRIIYRRLTEDSTAIEMWSETSGQWTIEFEEEVNLILKADGAAEL